MQHSTIQYLTDSLNISHQFFIRLYCRPHLIQQSNFQHNSAQPAATANEFLSLCYYQNVSEYDDWETVFEILNRCQPVHNLLVYLAVPPHVFTVATKAMKAALEAISLTGFVRVILEKPFGSDTDSCRALLDTLKRQKWSESNLYRFDHYLGKETVRSIVTLRQNHKSLQAIWNKNCIQSVHILLKEPFGIEGRGGYFDAYGIIRDVVQNHLLQVLTLIAMELSDDDHDDDEVWANDQIRNAKVNVLKCMPRVQLRDCLIGQYNGYSNDASIENNETRTATYVCIRTLVNNRTWKGIPFILEAGKALDERLCEARLYLRKRRDVLVFRIQPSPAVFFTTADRTTPCVSERPVGTECNKGGGGAYAKLVLDVLRGRLANFVRDDELVEAWRIFTPVLHQYEATASVQRPLPYPRGSTGPACRREFLLQSMGLDAPTTTRIRSAL